METIVLWVLDPLSGGYPDNVVIAGNPARVVCTLDEYYQKRKIDGWTMQKDVHWKFIIIQDGGQQLKKCRTVFIGCMLLEHKRA